MKVLTVRVLLKKKKKMYNTIFYKYNKILCYFINYIFLSQELTQQFDKDFYKTLALLKNKDPKIYNQNVTFFDDTNKAQEEYIEKKKQKTKKEKAIFLRDYERNIIVEREGKFSDSEDESIPKKDKSETKQITYAQEQKELKESFKGALHDEEEEDDLLKPKTKSESEKAKVSYP